MSAPATIPVHSQWDPAISPSRSGDPAWVVAHLFPPQGSWTERDFLSLNTNLPVELAYGHLELLPMPSRTHQLLLKYLLAVLDAFVVGSNLGEVLFAPYSVRLWGDHVRQPDLLFLRVGRPGDREQFADGADLAMEIVSPGAKNRDHDFVTKRAEYAQAGIPEYWIVDPEKNEVHVLVLVLDNGSYREYGVFKPGDTATSMLLPGFAVDVTALFQAGESSN